jgi:hypothetical protein
MRTLFESRKSMLGVQIPSILLSLTFFNPVTGLPFGARSPLAFSDASATTSAKTSAKANELAGQAIDALADLRASTEERTERKGRLLKASEEFLNLRRDHKNK